MLKDDVKLALRIKNTAYDNEINDIIDACKSELRLIGIINDKLEEKGQEGIDSLVKRAIILYAKANFGLDNADSERYQKAYDALKIHLALSQEYTNEVVS